MTPRNTALANNRVRVIGGKWRRSIIAFAPAEGLRPTPGRVRETVFNWLQRQITGSACLDLFAGSGACGIEALSRGAAEVLFIDNDRNVCSAIKNNLLRLGVEAPSVLNTDSLAWLDNATAAHRQRFSVAFVDPPYAENLAVRACHLLASSGVLIPGAQIYVELDKRIDEKDIPTGWKVLKHKKAGSVQHYLMQAA